MMDSPFYRSNHRNYPTRRPYYYHPSSPSPAVREIPVGRQPAPAPKVVSIPVHYVGSDLSRSDSAVKIQKVFRGFLVRKSVKKIAAIRAEVNEIEKRISMKETVELIRRDSRERLKVNEMLMSLLFKLDSVRGVDSGVRDCRKAVIKKAIGLQEMVDSIVAASAASADVASGPDNNDDDSVGPADEAGKDSAQNSPAGEKDVDPAPETADKSLGEIMELHVHRRSTEAEAEAEAEAVVEEESEMAQGNAKLSGENRVVEDEERDLGTTVASDFAENIGNTQTESEEDSSANPESWLEGDEECEDDKPENGMEIQQKEEDRMEGKEAIGGVKEEQNNKSRELLERMMEDNGKMMELMAELFDRNAMQTRLLSSLSQRVERLERAFMCEKLRRKKKRNVAGLADCLESTQDIKKYGKR